MFFTLFFFFPVYSFIHLFSFLSLLFILFFILFLSSFFDLPSPMFFPFSFLLLISSSCPAGLHFFPSYGLTLFLSPFFFIPFDVFQISVTLLLFSFPFPHTYPFSFLFLPIPVFISLHPSFSAVSLFHLLLFSDLFTSILSFFFLLSLPLSYPSISPSSCFPPPLMFHFFVIFLSEAK